jgi:hypothetical protein
MFTFISIFPVLLFPGMCRAVLDFYFLCHIIILTAVTDTAAIDLLSDSWKIGKIRFSNILSTFVLLVSLRKEVMLKSEDYGGQTYRAHVSVITSGQNFHKTAEVRPTYVHCNSISSLIQT